MSKISAFFFRGLEGLMVFLLAGMVVMVFGNVVLRYVFNPASTHRKSCRASSSSG